MRTRLFEVFGRTVRVTHNGDGWDVFYQSPDGKRRPAKDLLVPSDVEEHDLARYLGDLCHEWASERYPQVLSLD